MLYILEKHENQLKKVITDSIRELDYLSRSAWQQVSSVPLVQRRELLPPSPLPQHKQMGVYTLPTTDSFCINIHLEDLQYGLGADIRSWIIFQLQISRLNKLPDDSGGRPQPRRAGSSPLDLVHRPEYLESYML